MQRNSAKTKIEEVIGLTPSQLKAIESLLSGSSLVDTAATAGVDRSTLSRWMKTDFEFQAALNQGREDLQSAYSARLEKLAEGAIKAVESAIQAGDSKTALEVLKGMGFLRGKKASIGLTSVAALERSAERQRMLELL